jgi:hypothetical protein
MIPEPEVRLGIRRYLQATKDPRKVIADTRAVYFGTVLKINPSPGARTRRRAFRAGSSMQLIHLGKLQTMNATLPPFRS